MAVTSTTISKIVSNISVSWLGGGSLSASGGVLTIASVTATTWSGTLTVSGGIINTAIGATSPSTGAFTSVTLSPFSMTAASTSVLRFSGTQAANVFQGYDGTNVYGITLYNGAAANVVIQSNGASSFAGGINSTSIGASGASTGAFTTLSASGLITSTAGNNANFINAASATTGYIYGQIVNTSGSLLYGVENSAGNGLTNGSTGYDGVIRCKTGLSISINDGSGTALHLSSSYADLYLPLFVHNDLIVTGQTTFGLGGVGGSPQYVFLNGGSGSGGGGYIGFMRNNSPSCYIGNYCALLGGTSSDGMFYGNADYRVYVGNGTLVGYYTTTGLAVTGDLSCTGALSKGSGSFRIEHPLVAKKDTHQLVHSFIEGPKADLIYRGKVTLTAGRATVNIDQAATMTEGTFEALCGDVQCFTTNESDWTPVRGSVLGNILTIEAKDEASTVEISWMVIGERKDQHMLETDWTDEAGHVIVEPLKKV